MESDGIYHLYLMQASAHIRSLSLWRWNYIPLRVRSPFYLPVIGWACGWLHLPAVVDKAASLSPGERGLPSASHTCFWGSTGQHVVCSLFYSAHLESGAQNHRPHMRLVDNWRLQASVLAYLRRIFRAQSKLKIPAKTGSSHPKCLL